MSLTGRENVGSRATAQRQLLARSARDTTLGSTASRVKAAGGSIPSWRELSEVRIGCGHVADDCPQ